MTRYQYLKSYQENDKVIKSYFDFTRQVFSFDLKEWRSAGHWKYNYIPHSLISDDQVIANISASMMQLQINGKDIQAVQLGSVGVLPDYRGKGLARDLMERVLEEYKSFSLIFLYASDEVSKFYTNFGFRQITESTPCLSLIPESKKFNPIKITLESEYLKRLMKAKLQHSSIIDARKNQSIYWYHLMYNFSEDLYYIEEKDVIFIASYLNNSVDLYDVLSEKSVSFEEIKAYILKDSTSYVRFHFTPDWLNVMYDVSPCEDNGLYVYGEFLANMSQCKFPETGKT